MGSHEQCKMNFFLRWIFGGRKCFEIDASASVDRQWDVTLNSTDLRQRNICPIEKRDILSIASFIGVSNCSDTFSIKWRRRSMWLEKTCYLTISILRENSSTFLYPFLKNKNIDCKIWCASFWNDNRQTVVDYF